MPNLRRAAVRVLGARLVELGFAARAWLLAPLVEAGLAVAGVERTLRFCAWVPPPRAPRDDRVTVQGGAAWVDRAYAVHVLRGRCLPRAVVQLLLHRLDGTSSRLVIGVRPAGHGLDAHAWVTAGEDVALPFVPVLVVDERGVRPATTASTAAR